jgi:hypothetical protein
LAQPKAKEKVQSAKDKRTDSEEASNMVKYAGYADSDEDLPPVVPRWKKIPQLLEISDSEESVKGKVAKKVHGAAAVHVADVTSDSEDEDTAIRVSVK